MFGFFKLNVVMKNSALTLIAVNVKSKNPNVK